jgi:hypothetical protein
MRPLSTSGVAQRHPTNGRVGQDRARLSAGPALYAPRRSLQSAGSMLELVGNELGAEVEGHAKERWRVARPNVALEQRRRTHPHRRPTPFEPARCRSGNAASKLRSAASLTALATHAGSATRSPRRSAAMRSNTVGVRVPGGSATCGSMSGTLEEVQPPRADGVHVRARRARRQPRGHRAEPAREAARDGQAERGLPHAWRKERDA